MRTRTSWREKLNDDRHTKVCPIPEGMQKRFGLGTMLIPKPLDVDALIRQVPKGRLITTGQIRAALASAAGASVTCPLVTGIAIRIAAEVAQEEIGQGKKLVTPYWRVVRDDGALLDKIPGGAANQAERLEAEGHILISGKPARVRLAEGVLVDVC